MKNKAAATSAAKQVSASGHDITRLKSGTAKLAKVTFFPFFLFLPGISFGDTAALCTGVLLDVGRSNKYSVAFAVYVRPVPAAPPTTTVVHIDYHVRNFAPISVISYISYTS